MTTFVVLLVGFPMLSIITVQPLVLVITLEALQVVLCDKELKIEYYKDVVYADGKTKLFDQYPSCKHWEKKYCHCKPKRYRGYVNPGGYVFFGDSEIEIYCKVIAALGNEESPLIVPFSVM